jgi:hypothetical protein
VECPTEAIFLACGAGGPQLKRTPLGAQPETILHISPCAPLGLALIACHPGSASRVGPAPIDSATAVRLAIAAVADTSDTLVNWIVAEYSHSKDGYLIYISPRIKPQYARPGRDGRQLITNDGGGRVHITNRGKIKLIEVY